MRRETVPRPGKSRVYVRAQTLRLAGRYALLLVVAAFMIGPFLWVLGTSLKVRAEVYAFPPQWWPDPVTLDNYVAVWNQLPIPRYFLNTVDITFWGVTLNLVLGSLAAYPLARLKFPGRDVLFAAMLSTMFIPNAAGMIVNFVTLQKLHLIDTHIGVFLPSSVTVFEIFLLRQAYITVPKELEDAARMDGCSELGIWWRIMLPLVKPTLATLTIFSFVAFWNSFMWAIIVLQSSDKYPLSAGLNYLKGSFTYNFAYISAGTIISIIPIIAVFLILQKYFIKGLTAGAIKG